MSDQDWWVELRCAACGWSALHNPAAAVEWLRGTGRLRSNSDADSQMLYELLLALAPQDRCPQCGAGGLSASPADDDQQGWPQARRCQACSRPIDAERLEIFPAAALCAGCQRLEDHGPPAGTGEYCQRCGAPLVVRLAGGAGIRRYRLACTGNPPCR